MGRGWVHTIRVASGNAKGKTFTKIAKEITVAVKLGGASPDSNARLRSCLKDAQKNSMPKDTIERAIKRGVGGSSEADIEEITYEGFGPHRVACIVETNTDNRNRTAQDIRAIFSRMGAGLGESGSVMWLFDRLALVIAKPKSPNADAEEAAINAGANEVEQAEEGNWLFYGDLKDLYSIQEGLEAAGWEVSKAELSYRPKTTVELTPEQEKELQEFMAKLEDHDDVRRIHLAV